jgi:hypothetical protein
MKSFKSGSSLITVLVNKTGENQILELEFLDRKTSGSIIFKNKSAEINGRSINISPEETIVVEWK